MNVANISRRSTKAAEAMLADVAGEKHAGGRPSAYDPRYCDLVIEEMSKGFSLSAFAGLIGVSRPTLNNWMGQHLEFFEAVSRAKAARLLLWEKKALEIAEKGGGQGSATMVIFALKNMGGEEWREKHQVQHSGAVGLGDLVAASYRTRSRTETATLV